MTLPVLRSQQAKRAGRCGPPGRQRGQDDPGASMGDPSAEEASLPASFQVLQIG